VSIVEARTRAENKKNAVRSDCVKSTPKEEGGGDTAWIGATPDVGVDASAIRLERIMHSYPGLCKAFLCDAEEKF